MYRVGIEFYFEISALNAFIANLIDYFFWIKWIGKWVVKSFVGYKLLTSNG